MFAAASSWHCAASFIIWKPLARRRSSGQYMPQIRTDKIIIISQALFSPAMPSSPLVPRSSSYLLALITLPPALGCPDSGPGVLQGSSCQTYLAAGQHRRAAMRERATQKKQKTKNSNINFPLENIQCSAISEKAELNFPFSENPVLPIGY